MLYKAQAQAQAQSPEVVVGLARAYDLESNYDEAKKYAEMALAIPGISKILQAQAYLVQANYWYMGNQDEGQVKAIENTNRALALDPVSVLAHLQLASIYWYQEKRDLRDQEVAAALAEAQKTNSSVDLAKVYLFKAGYNYSISEFQPALEQVNLAIQESPKNVNVYVLRAQIYGKMGKAAEAKADLEAVSKMAPKNAKFYSNSSGVFYSLGDYQKALSDYKTALSLPPKPQGSAYGWLSALYSYVGNYDQALVEAKKAAEMDPTDHYAFGRIGWVYYLLKDYDQALASFNSMKKIPGWNEEWYYSNLTEIYYAKASDPRYSAEKEQLLKLAQESLAKAIELDKNNEDKQLAEYKCFYLNDKPACPIALAYYKEQPQGNLPNDKQATIAKLEEKIKQNQSAQ